MYQDMIALTGALALSGIALGALALLVERLFAIWVGGPWPILVLAVTGVTAGIIWSLFRRQDDTYVAVALDERLGLKDRIASALHFVGQADKHPFARQIVDEAESAATLAKLEKCFPYKAPKAWAWVPVLLVLAAGLYYFVDQRDLLGIQARRDQAVAQQQQAQVIDENVQEVLKAVKQVQATLPPTDEPLDKATDEPLAKAGTMGENANKPESNKEAIAELSDLQEKLDKTASQADKEVTALKNALTNIQTGQGPADQFADALRRGDFDAAQSALQQLAQNTAGMSANEKQAVADQLNNIGQQLQQMAQQQQQQQQPPDPNQPNQQNQQQAQQQQNQAGQPQQGQGQQNQQAQNQNQNQNQQQSQNQNQQANNSQSNPSQGQCSGACNSLGQGLQQMAQQMQGQGQNPGQGQQQGQGQGQGQGQQNAQQALSQMSQMQNQLQQMQQAQQQAQQALSGNKAGNSGLQQGKGNPGASGNSFGRGYAGPTAGPETKVENYQTDAVSEGVSKDGRIIASWLENGENAKGEAKVLIDKQVTNAQRSATQAVTESRIPGKYQQSVRSYFDQIPETVEQSRAPQAPR